MIVIVGGGVMGCTLAYTLARRGAEVTLLERSHLGVGASGVPVALLNPYRGRSARASEFDLRALAAMWRLVDDLERRGLTTGVVQSGVVRVASNVKQAKTWQKRDGVTWFEVAKVPTGFHAPFGGFIAASGGWLRPELWLRALVQAAGVHGATILEHRDVTHIGGPLGDRLFRVCSAHEVLHARTVVLCSGGAALGEAELGLEQVAGEVIGLTLPGAAAPPYPLAGAVYGAQVGQTFYLGGNHRPADQTAESAPAQLQRAGGWFVPALRGATLESVWHGVRVKAENNLPVVRELRPGVWFAGGLAGRGFLASAHVAETLGERLWPSSR